MFWKQWEDWKPHIGRSPHSGFAEGTVQQREKAAQAFSRIARNNGGQLEDKELQARSLVLLESLVEKDKSILVRFHCIVAHSILGGHPHRAKS